MEIKKIIDFLESQGDWVNRAYTKDQVLYGSSETEVEEVMICWVATIDVINQAIKKGCKFIITHENPFYIVSTAIPSNVLEAQEKKKSLLKENSITVYRCHDLWDLYPKYGVRDVWGKTLGFDFHKLEEDSYLKVAQGINMQFDDLAHHVIKCIKPYAQDGIQVIGNSKKMIRCLGIGTGACTNLFTMARHGVDACIVSDDGINNWSSVQWAVDNDIPLLIVNHMTSEDPGMEGMAHYLRSVIPNIKFTYIPNTYKIRYLK